MNLMQFAQLIERRSVQVEHNSLQLKKKVVTEVHKNVSQNTPADTGRAISNWKISLLTSPSFSIFPYAPGRLGNTKDANINATIATASPIIASIKLGQVVMITNSVDYVQDLNDGTSKQQPAGFVQRAIQHGDTIVASSKIIAS